MQVNGVEDNTDNLGSQYMNERQLQVRSALINEVD